ncbi:hypothetical protein B0T10DRAFT_550784 [Thelonectria olida]|uniref:Ankyrin repeat protein n=1 Tax=Thelonectria olida TaxID=1576542 RepID=A0A9P8VYR7_9HYPO|nr:hypothetical protein B0T10DRAFT_550784 [Thelonectria olida]
MSTSSDSEDAKFSRPPLWTNSAQRKVIRLYLYTTLPVKKIVEAVYSENYETVPGKESAHKKLNALLDKEPRWLHPRTESDMGRRLNALSFSPGWSSLAKDDVADDTKSVLQQNSTLMTKQESETSPATLQIPPPSSMQDAAKPTFGEADIMDWGSSSSPLETFLRRTTFASLPTPSTTGSLKSVMADYPEPYIKVVKQLIRGPSVSADCPNSPPVSSLIPSDTTWFDDGDAPPMSDGPYFLPSDFLNLDLLLQHQPPCSPDSEQHSHRSCLCSARNDITTSIFVTAGGLTPLAMHILQKGLPGIDLTISDDFGNTVLHFLAARGMVDNLLEVIGSDRCNLILNARNTAGQTLLHALNRSCFPEFDALCELLLLLSARAFDFQARDYFGRTFAHLLFAGDMPRGELERVAADYPELFKDAKRDAFNVSPTPLLQAIGDINRTDTEAMDIDPLSGRHSSFTSETYQDIALERLSSLLAFVRSARDNPAAQYLDGSNGLHCLAVVPLSVPTAMGNPESEQAPGKTSRVRRAMHEPKKDSSTERLKFRLELLEGLLAAGIDPNHYDHNGNTPLMAFTALLPEDGDYKVGPKILERLLFAGAEVNARNRRGESALHIAVRCGRKLAVRTLVEQGANVHVRDAAGRSLLEVIDVKLRGLSDHHVKEYAHFEACRAWLSGKAEAVRNPTVMQEWGIKGKALSPIRELTKTAHDLQLPTTPREPRTGHPEFLKSGGEMHEPKRDEEDTKILFSQSSVPKTPRRDGIDTLNPVYQTSTDLVPALSDVAEGFSRAMLIAMRPDLDCGAATNWSRKRVLPLLRRALKSFGSSAEVDRSVVAQVEGVKSIRRLKLTIAQRIQDGILALDQESERKQASEDFIHVEEDDYSESTSSDSLTDPTADSRTQTQTAASTIPTEILEHFTKQTAFTDLVRSTEQLFQRYHAPKMPFIRRVTSVSLRSYFANAHFEAGRLCAMFRIDWDLREFLTNNYESGIRQKLRNVIAITGETNNAQLCSVSEYFRWCWAPHHEDLLLAIEREKLGKGIESLSPLCRDLHSRSDMDTGELPTLSFDSSMKIITVRGSEEFIVSIAQQAAWLAAACQEKQPHPTYAYVAFEESSLDSSEAPVFNVDVRLEDAPPEQGNGGCWRNLMGTTILIQGFSTPERNHDEKGLEVSIPVMAMISGTPNAVTLGGGFVFKGRCHALVPIERLGSSFQWHILDAYPRKLEWDDIDKACPTRLRGKDISDDLWESRSFFGWCPRVLELLGTELFEYASVRYSEARIPSKHAQVDKFVFGFSQWVTLTADISLGRRDGVFNQRPDDYETLLNDARSTHVILHDTFHKRATQTNAEDLILHLILHRKRLPKPVHEEVEAPGVEESELGEALEVALPDRGAKSTRQVMRTNAERIVSLRRQFSSAEPETRRFKNDVKLLYSTIDGLWAHNYAGGGGAKPLKLGFDLGQNVQGWEYMDVLEDSRWMSPKSINLQRSSGNWHQYAKDIRALVFFGANFGEVLLPALPAAICPGFTSLPKDACYLGVRVDALEYLFHRQGSLDDQKKLTDSGLTIQGHADLFKPCTAGLGSPCSKCSSNHLSDPSTTGRNLANDDVMNGAGFIATSENIFLKVFKILLQEAAKRNMKMPPVVPPLAATTGDSSWSAEWRAVEFFGPPCIVDVDAVIN